MTTVRFARQTVVPPGQHPAVVRHEAGSRLVSAHRGTLRHRGLATNSRPPRSGRTRSSGGEEASDDTTDQPLRRWQPAGGRGK